MEPAYLKRFVIYGLPKGKGRPQFTTINGHTRAITPEATVNYENLVKMEYHAQLGDYSIPPKTMIFALIDAFLPIPNSISNKKREQMIAGTIRPIIKPDYDNVGKIVCDSLNKIAYYDDSAIVDGRVRKFYSEKPRVEVFLSTEEIDSKTIDDWRKKNHA